jgi:prenyltransferase beta subunit
MNETLKPQNILRHINNFSSSDGAISSSVSKAADPMTTSQVAILAHDISSVRVRLENKYAAAARFLESQQRPDGHWDRDGDDWHMSITAWAVLALAAYGTNYRASLQEGVNWIAARQAADGSFPQSDITNVANTYSTSYAAAALFAAQGNSHCLELAVKWLQKMQSRNGGFADSYTLQFGPEPSLTAYVAHALSRIPIMMAEDIIARCSDFIAGRQRPSGAWPAWYEETDSIEGTAAALRVLLRQPTRYRKQIDGGLAYLHYAANINDLDNWVVISLAYVVLGLLDMTWEEVADIRSAMQRAQNYILSLQRPDGGYGLPGGESSEAWGTAECVLATSIPSVTESVQRGLDWLRGAVHDDGGWSSGAYANVTGGDSDVSATSYALRALACGGLPSDRGLIEGARTWLVQHQRPDGSWGVARADEDRGYIGQTGFAISALARAPAEHRAAEAVQSALYYLYDTQRVGGGWGLAPGHEIDATLTAYALRGIIDVAVLRGQSAQPRIFLRWLDNIQQTQHANGSWSDWYGNAFSVEATGYVVELAACLGIVSEPGGAHPPWLARALSFLARAQHPNGGWGIDPNEPASHWVTHSVVIALGALLGDASHIAAKLDLLASPDEKYSENSSKNASTNHYDFAISFATSQRAYAKALAIKLQQRGASVFFDAFESADLWGANLVDRFTHIYREGARLCIMIISQDYAERAWPKLERQSAQARALTANEDYILPVRVGGYTRTPGLLDTIGYIDAEEYDIDEIAALAMAKLQRASS